MGRKRGCAIFENRQFRNMNGESNEFFLFITFLRRKFSTPVKNEPLP